jgi:hypothetical protein
MAGLLTTAAKAGVKANAANAGLLSPGIRAFHGSPYDFDRFSTGSIGTGEGSQLHGQGLYFTEDQNVARQYKNKPRKGPGKMYEVNINADRSTFVKLDKPVSDQPKKVQLAYERFSAESPQDKNVFGEAETEEQHFRRFTQSPLGAEIMKSEGVPGIEYGNAFTRHKPDDKQSKNFVIFDDQIIEISKKYGVTIPVAAAMLSQTEDAEAGFLTTPANLIRIGMLKPQSAENPSAVKSAMTKYDKAMRDNKAFRFREKLRADVENQTQSIDIGERNILDVADLVGKVGVPVAGDTSVTGKILETIGGQNLDSPVGVEGGSNFGLRYKPQGYGWASMENAARKKQENFALAADETGGMQPVGIFNAMGREAVNFSTPPAETMLQQALSLPIKKRDVKAFDDELRKLRPDWVGLNHPGAMDQIMGRGDYPQKGAGKLRSEFVKEMSKARHRDVGFPIKEDVHSEILQPEIANLPIGSSGFSMFDAQPDANIIGGSPHQSYDTIIPGNYIGGFDESVPARVMFPKTFADLDQRTNKAGKPFTEQQKTGSLVMDPKLYEVFDDQWADGIYKYQQEQAKKQRGAANPAALAATAAATGGLLGSGQVEGGIDKVAGIADAAANAASGMVAPILSAPGAVARYLGDRYVPGVDFSAEDIARERQNTEQFFDYQPRTQLGQQYSDQGLQALGGLLAPVVEASQGSQIIDLLSKGYNKMGKKEKELTKALLDMSPI